MPSKEPANIKSSSPAADPGTAIEKVDRVPVSLGIVPTTLEEGWRLAQHFAKSALVPKNFFEKPHDILVAIQLGVEVGFAPMQALQSIAVINGRPSIWGDGFLALIMSSPLYMDHAEWYEVNGTETDTITADDLKQDTTAAICMFQRRGKASPTSARFSIAQAKKANLLGKAGPWQDYPDRMLKMRARSWAGRDAFPDLLRGLRTAEEAIDEPTTAAPSPGLPIRPRRLHVEEEPGPGSRDVPSSTPPPPPVEDEPPPPAAELTADEIFTRRKK